MADSNPQKEKVSESEVGRIKKLCEKAMAENTKREQEKVMATKKEEAAKRKQLLYKQQLRMKQRKYQDEVLRAMREGVRYLESDEE